MIAQPHNSPPPGGGTILLVEDHADTAVLMTKVLGRAGYDVASAVNCAEARRAAAARRFDLMLCDVGLSDGDGCDLFRELRRQYGLDGIVCTGFSAPHDLAKTAEAGFVLHLTKPVTVEALLAAVRLVIRQREDRASGDVRPKENP